MEQSKTTVSISCTFPCNSTSTITPNSIPSAPVLNTSTIPFEPTFAFGVGSKAKFINLTKNNQNIKLFYAVSHLGIIYDNSTNNMQFLIGHKNAVVSISADMLGKWLVTADSDKDHSIVVWDADDCTPMYTIFEPHGESGICLIALSPDAKYLISIGKEPDPLLKLWIWSNGNDTPDDTFVIKKSFGEPKEVNFDPNETSYFVVTFPEVVIFFTWTDSKLTYFVPDMKRMKSKNYGQFQASTYVKYGHECVTVTSMGWVIVWGISFFEVPFLSIPNSNEKLFIKAVRLQKNSITCIKFIDNHIMTGDVNGYIKFYDRKLKILYWCQHFTLDSIVALRYNMEKTYITKQSHNILEFDPNRVNYDDDRSDGNEIIYANLRTEDRKIATDALVRDFVVSTSTGQMVYVDFINNDKLDLLRIPMSSITSMAVHDQKPILCFGFANGTVASFNYETGRPILSYRVMHSKEEEYNEITCIQYSPQGLYLACSTAGGHLWFLEPSILKPYFKKPFIYDHSRIHKIQFSEDNKYISYFDSSMAVCLLKRNEHNILDWVFHGRYIAHFKEITDLLFCYPSRLFSISKDRCLVEYDVLNSEVGKLELISSTVVTQTGYPICFLVYVISIEMSELQFLISTNHYKYIIINEVGNSHERTFAAPTMAIPVHQFSKVPLTEKYMLFSTDKYLGIQMLPLSGNPYQRVVMLVHPEKLRKYAISNCGKYVFTFGYNDRVALMWNIKLRSVDAMCDVGGKELQPYYCLIEGGNEGRLFTEMNALFYYMQILNEGEDSSLPRRAHDKLPIHVLPNLLRALGFFPSELELDNIMSEVRQFYAIGVDDDKMEISFTRFVKLFINHRHVNKYSMADIKWAFDQFAVDGCITQDEFIDVMTTKGEPFTPEALNHCLSILTFSHHHAEAQPKTNEELIPEILTYDSFISDFLGIIKEEPHQ